MSENTGDLVILSETSTTKRISFELHKKIEMFKTKITKQVQFMGKDMKVVVIDTDMSGIMELSHCETVATISSGGRKILRLQFTTYWHRYVQEVKTICNVRIFKKIGIKWSVDLLEKFLKNSRIQLDDPSDRALLEKKLSSNDGHISDYDVQIM